MNKQKKPKQIIQEEPADVNPMEELAKETNPGQEEAEEPTEEKESQRWVVGEVATSTEKVIHDKETNKSYDIYSSIALILNKVYEI